MAAVAILMLGIGGWLMYESVKGASSISDLTTRIRTNAPAATVPATITAPTLP